MVQTACVRQMVAFTGNDRFTKKVSSGSLTVLPRMGTGKVALVVPAGNVTVVVVVVKSFVPAVPVAVEQRTLTSTIAGLESVNAKKTFFVPTSPSIMFVSAMPISGGGSSSRTVTMPI